MLKTPYATLLLVCLVACSESPSTVSDAATSIHPPDCAPDPSGEPSWQVLDLCRSEGQLLSVSAHTHNDVWVVGAGGQILHFDGCRWSSVASGVTTDLWWTTSVGNTVFITGQNGAVVRVPRDRLAPATSMDTPTDVTLFGIWAASESDAWSVGFDPLDPDSDSVILRLVDGVWTSIDFPIGVDPKTDLFKVWGRAADDVWIVGRDGVILHFDGTALSRVESPDTDWVTVTGTSDKMIMVGGSQTGALAILEQGELTSISLDSVPPLQGICMGTKGQGIATGLFGAILQKQTDGSWLTDYNAPLDLFTPGEPPVEGCTTVIPDYHACAIDDRGGIYLVGGGFSSGLRDGTLLYYGPAHSTDGL